MRLISKAASGPGAVLLALLILTGCTGIPDNVEPVENFELERYLGTWYEIVRLDHRFERGLEAVTASYSLREDGGVDVVNRGYNTEKGEWDEATGKAYFVGAPTEGRLKVSFFGPFYGAYTIARLDQEEYQWSLVVGPNTSYLWLLSRSPEMDPQTISELVDYAAGLGFDAEQLITVNHDIHHLPPAP